MHTIVIATKKNSLTHWKVVICRVNVDCVNGYLAKAQAIKKRAKMRLDKKSDVGDCTSRS